MKKFILFTDLDDTLFQSWRKKAPQADSQALAFLSNGEAISYADRKQQQWLQYWLINSIVIPVTARNLDAFYRVKIDFQHHAVINYGGMIVLPDGQLDAEWLAQSALQAQQSAPRLQALMTALQQQLPRAVVSDLNICLVEDQGIVFYLLVKSRTQQQAHLQQAVQLLKTLRLPEEKLHVHANNVALLPPWLDKAHAVEALLCRYRAQQPELVSIGMGDSRIDLPFMRQCDYIITPNQSQIVHDCFAEPRQ